MKFAVQRNKFRNLQLNLLAIFDFNELATNAKRQLLNKKGFIKRLDSFCCLFAYTFLV